MQATVEATATPRPTYTPRPTPTDTPRPTPKLAPTQVPALTPLAQPAEAEVLFNPEEYDIQCMDRALGMDISDQIIHMGRPPTGVELVQIEQCLVGAEADTPVGQITSGGFGPTVGGPVAMGYLPVALATPGTTVHGELRGKRLPLTVTALPFTPANFKR